MAGFLLLLAGCQPQADKKAFGVFNEGVALSLRAAEQADTGLSRPLERQAIGKYRQALAQDPAHRMVRSALGPQLLPARQVRYGHRVV